MPDLGPVFGALLDAFGPVIGAALKALLKTVFGMVLLGAVVTGTTVYFAAQGSWLRGLIAAALSLVALGVVTGILAVKNAIMRGLLHGLQKLQLGTRVLKLVFNQLGVTEESTQGERAGSVGRVVEKLPLRDAEARLSGAVNGLLAERAAKTGLRAWLARKLVESALQRIERITLAKFRSEDAKTGGVDLLVVRDELAAGIDGTLASTISGQLNKVNILVAGLYVVFAVVIAAVLPRLVPG
ncbi:MAG: hypothetical protein JNK82_21935 [Myxococcaceae bacterium]|nr:hypothetical protein [Myxococcaceae bacterium]